MKVATTLLAASVIVASALASPSILSPKSKRQDEAPTKFRVMSEAPDAPDIDSQWMQAVGRHFWLGGNASTYCPTVVGDNCPFGKDTVILGLNALDTMVPGGQQLYVETSGATGFTQAHSASIPPGALVGYYEYVPGEGLGSYSWGGWDATGFMACPDPESGGFYQVFANISNATVPSGNRDDCIDFVARVMTLRAAAWQYV